MFSALSQRFTDEYDFQEDDIMEKCKLIIAFKDPPAGFGLKLKDIAATRTENSCAYRANAAGKGSRRAATTTSWMPL